MTTIQPRPDISMYKFDVRACQKAHLTLSADSRRNEMDYEIILGDENNEKVYIKDANGEVSIECAFNPCAAKSIYISFLAGFRKRIQKKLLQ